MDKKKLEAFKKRLETRLLHFQQFPGTQEYGDQYWRGYTYVWNDEQTDADLLDEKGLDRGGSRNCAAW